jgi:NADH-quinone oxidoreductase subunit E
VPKENPAAVPLTDESLARAQELIARYPEPRSALLPILFLLQAEDGYVSPAGVAQAAGLLGLTKAEVGAVATFYTMFRRRPVGKYIVSVCRTLSCQLRGSRELADALAERLGTPLGGTDPSGMVTVEEVECLAACDGAPVVQVNTENYERLSTQQALELVEALLRDEVPQPTFSADGSVTEPSAAALHWRLAGLGDPPARLVGARPGEPAGAPTAFPPQPPAPTVTEDPTDRSVQELRTGVDHGGLRPGPDGAGRAPAGQASARPEDEEGDGGHGRRAAGQDARAAEAEAPQPSSPEPGRAPEEAEDQAGPHEREQPGGGAQ